MNTDGKIQRVHARKADPMRDPEAFNEPHEAFLNGWLPLPSTGVPEHPPGKLELRSANGYTASFEVNNSNVFKGCKTFANCSHKVVAYRFTPSEPQAEPNAKRDLLGEGGWFHVFNGKCNENLFMGEPLECNLVDGTFKIFHYSGNFHPGIVAARRKPIKKGADYNETHKLADDLLKEMIRLKNLGTSQPLIFSSEQLDATHWNAKDFHAEEYLSDRDAAYLRFRQSPRGKQALAQIGKSFETPVAPLGESAMLEIFGQALSAFEAEIERKKK